MVYVQTPQVIRVNLPRQGAERFIHHSAFFISLSAQFSAHIIPNSSWQIIAAIIFFFAAIIFLIAAIIFLIAAIKLERN